MNKIDLFSHQMNETELAEAKLCDEILKAFQGSYKPPCFSGSIGVSLTTFYVEGCGYITLYHKGITVILTPFLKCDEIVFAKTREDYFVALMNYLGLNDCTIDTIMKNCAVMRVIEEHNERG